jgi:hypothetical protein
MGERDDAELLRKFSTKYVTHKVARIRMVCRDWSLLITDSVD